MLAKIQKASEKKRKMMVLGLIGVIVLIFIIIRFLGGSEDTWICDNGRWVKHGDPEAPMPTKICPKNIR